MSVSFGCRVMTGHVPSIQFQCNAHHECEEVPNIQDPCLLSHSGCWHNMPTQRHSRRPEAEHHHRWCFDASRYSRRRLLPAEWQSFEWFGDGQDIPRLCGKSAKFYTTSDMTAHSGSNSVSVQINFEYFSIRRRWSIKLHSPFAN